MDNSAQNTDAKVDATNLKIIPGKAYLDLTVTPILLQGLAELSRVRPKNPVNWLATYLLNNNPESKK